MQLFLSNWSSALTLPATASAVQLSVPDADAALLTGLGTGDHYLLTLALRDINGIETAWEIVRVPGRTAGVLDVLRGQEGTTALELEAGTSISARLTQATMETLRDNGGPALSDTAPQALGAAAPGTSPAASRDDHVHDLPTPAEIGAATEAQGAAAESAVQPEGLAAPVLTESTIARTLALTDAGAFIRFTSASASTCTVPPQVDVGWPADAEVYIYRDAVGNLALTAGAGVTLKAPSGGTLVMTDGMGVGLKLVAENAWLVIGQTVAA